MSSRPTGVAHSGRSRWGASVSPVRQKRSAAAVAISRGLLAVVAAVRHEVLEDHLLQVAVLGVDGGERLERRHALVLGLADADEDAARERDPQLARGADRGQPQRGVLGRRALVGDEIGPDRLDHEPLRGRHLAQPREVGAAEDAEVGVREQPALERALAGPDDVGDEVREAQRRRRVRTPGWAPGSSPVSTSSSLTWRRAAPSRSASTSSGSCRCGRWVLNAQYLQWATQVRDSDNVTLREKVTRRRISSSLDRPPYAPGAMPVRRTPPPCSSRCSRPRRRRAAGEGSEDRPDRPATLVLDFQPNAVHTGIFLALQRDFDDAEGVGLRVQVPSSSTDAVKLLLAGRAQFAILDIHDLALARERGRDVVGVMALVQRPLAAVLAQPGVRRPRELEGRRAGVTGLPSDDAVLASVVRGDGGDPRGCAG